jgi:extracellular elastinolytic metalloproteinase
MKFGRLSLTVALAFALLPLAATAAVDPLAAARGHLDANRARYNLTAADLSGMTVSDNYASRHNGVRHVYWVQRHAGIAVFNGIANVSVKPDGSLVHMGSRFAPNLAGTANATAPLITVSDAVRRAAQHLGLIASDLTVARTLGGAEQALVFTGAGFSRSEVPVKLTYYRASTNSVRLAWDIAIEPDSLHYWEVLVDAVNGSILFKFNHVQSDSYKVFAWPAESPNHVRMSLPRPPGDGREVVNDTAADPVASPYGWHDLNGLAGADTVDTSGNNVSAQTDLDNNDVYVPTQDVRPLSTTRDFQPVLDLSKFADTYREAAVVNLFYWNNVNHDLHYLYGFDEAAGNFQMNNYTLAGTGADAVTAEAQDGSGTNNANMRTPADGEAPRMQMYVWTPRISNEVAVNSPAGLGPYPASAAAWGPPLNETGISGDVVLANDGAGTTADACEALPSSVAGKIVLAERGTCNFIVKVQNAQAAGAIAAILYNNQPGDPITMGGTEDPANPVTISSVMITQDGGIELRDSLPANVTLHNISASIPTRDSDLDNGVIIHEYGHGVSNRLTGGPARVTCLTHAQQGGEGWSDFWAVAFTQRAGATGAEPRGIGTYLYYEDNPATGRGIRPYPYSTDMRVNPQTYGDLARGTLAVPHGTGSVWATTLWEMYWAIVNGVPSLGLPGYGFRENLYDMTGPLAGNQIAIQLVSDGLKLQPCLPTYVDARDAILAADEANYGGRHKWHIWWAFAKRGLGAGANDNDGGLLVAESFAMPAGAPGACTEAPAFNGLERIVPATDGTCAISLYWSTTSSDPCNTGRISYSIYRGTTSTFTPGASNRIASGLTTTSYTDEAVVGGTRYYYIVRAVDGFGNEDPNRNIQSEVPAGTLAPGGSFTDNGGDTGPTRFTATGGWVIRPTGGVGHTAATPSKQYATSAAGNYPNMACMQLTSDTIYLGANPTLSFATIWAIEPTWDAGILEITTADSGFTQWEKVDMTYPGIILGADGSEIACPNPGMRKQQTAFTGTSAVLWVTFNVPLTAYANQPVRVRFVFGSDAGTGDAGWRLDNISVTNVMQSGACNTRPDAVDDATSAAEDNATTVNVLANDTDMNGDTLSVTRAAGASHGSTRVNANNTVTYTPAANFHGNDSFTYTISDGKGGTDTATVSVTVTSVNDAPVAANDTGPVVKNSGTDFAVLDNDSDADGDPLRVTAVTQPAHGSAIINTDQTIRYTPRKGFKGTDSFDYVISDGNGGTARATVTVSVTR